MSETPVALVLASASPARLAILTAAGIDPVVIVSDVDEDEVVAKYGVVDAEDVALVLAKAKAEAVSPLVDEVEDVPDGAIVVGCDSVLQLGGEVFGKPITPQVARERWKDMRGRSGVLHTGHWVIDARADGGGGTLGAVASTTVHFAKVTDEEIDAYVATGEPLSVAGGFTLDGLGGAFVRGVEGDPHNVVGLSLPLLRDLLKDLDITWPSLWRPTP